MSEPRTIGIHAPDNVPLRASVWTLPQGATRRGVCVLLNGLTEFVEKYQEVADELLARGFTVVSLDWRSQGASERLGGSNHKIHVRDFDEYDLDLTTLTRDVVNRLDEGGPPEVPVIALAHSMGAHILLRALHEHGGRRRFAAAVLVAPMIEIETGGRSAFGMRCLTALANLRRPSKRYVPGTAGRDPLTLPFEKNVVTKDRARFERTRAILRAHPFLRTFGPTFGWLRAALRSIAQITRRGYPEAIATPVLIVGAGHDRVVVTAAAREYAKRLSNARFVEIADAEHEILMERDPIREEFWDAFDGFVDAHLPPE